MSSSLARLQRVSKTAYDCAAVRAAVHAGTGSPVADPLASDMLRGNTGSPMARLAHLLIKFGALGVLTWMIRRTAPGAETFIFARNAIPEALIRDALIAQPDTQTVVLGAGLDTSGLRIGAERLASGLPPGRFFEVDLPAMQEEKRRQVARLFGWRSGLSDAHITYVPCSFGEHELAPALTHAGFDPGAPSVWVWSGVVHYLPETAVRASIAEIRKVAQRGSHLFFDYILKEAYADPEGYGFAKTKKRFESYGEMITFGLPEDAIGVRSWLETQGLALDRIVTPQDMADLYQHHVGRPPAAIAPRCSNFCIARFQG